MKLTSKITLTLLLSIIISCDKCKKDPPPEPQICEINGEVFDSEKGRQQMMDYMYFKVGTWWVYEEETTGALDTITVYLNQNDIDENDFHWFICKTHSSYTDYNYYYEYHESFTGVCHINRACACQRVQRAKTQPGDFVGANRDFFFPAQVGDFQYVGGADLVNYLNRITSVESEKIINEIVYHNVITYDIGWTWSENGQHTIFLLAENVGIIKKELINDNEVWNLINFNIVQ